jgi:hypothetical protein
MPSYLWFPNQSVALFAIGLSSTAVAADEFNNARYFYGDIHVHTGLSGDGLSLDYGNICSPNASNQCGAIDDLVENAKAHSLDFISVTDHINGFQGAEDRSLFKAIQIKLMNANDPANDFITLPGAEFWFQESGNGEFYGHRNLYFFAHNKRLSQMTLDSLQFNGTSTRVTDCDEIWTIMEQMEEVYGDVLLLPHHPAGYRSLNVPWSCFNDTYTPSVEVYSQHGNSMQGFPIFDPLTAPGSYEMGGAVEDAIHPALFGHTIGFFSSTDNHMTMPGDICNSNTNSATGMLYGGGLSVVMLDEGTPFTRASIYEALVNRKTYATSGPMLPVTVNYSVDGILVGEMGDVINLEIGDPVDVEVRIPNDYVPHVTSVSLRYPDMTSGDKALWLESDMSYAKNGVWTASFAHTPLVLYPTIHIDGKSWYGKENCTDGGKDSDEAVWLSPTWLNEVQLDTDAETRTSDTQDNDSETGLTGAGSSKSCGGCGTSVLPFSLGYLAFLVPIILGRRRATYVVSDDTPRHQS